MVARGRQKRADYVLYLKPNIPVAVIEAKDATHAISDSIQQALTVRGKLVAQDPGDEPALALLKCIAAEKVRLVSSGVVKDDRATKDPVHNVELFDLPQGWAWANLLSLCISVTDCDHQPPPKADRGIPFLVIGDVRTKSSRSRRAARARGPRRKLHAFRRGRRDRAGACGCAGVLHVGGGVGRVAGVLVLPARLG